MNLEFDERMAALEAEWRQVYEASIAARSDLDRLCGCEPQNGVVHLARSRLERLEVLKDRVMKKIDSLEESVGGGFRVSGGH